MLLLDIARLLLETAAALLGVSLLLRLYMNWAGMPGRNPLAQFVHALTDWLVRPLRRVIPPAGRLDLASLVGALLVALLLLLLIDLLAGGVVFWERVLIKAPFLVMRWALYLAMWLTIIHVILSWVNPFAPVAPAIGMLVRPLLAPFQRILPQLNGIDLSPLVLIVLVNVMLLVLDRVGF